MVIRFQCLKAPFWLFKETDTVWVIWFIRQASWSKEPPPKKSFATVELVRESPYAIAYSVSKRKNKRWRVHRRTKLWTVLRLLWLALFRNHKEQ